MLWLGCSLSSHAAPLRLSNPDTQALDQAVAQREAQPLQQSGMAADPARSGPAVISDQIPAGPTPSQILQDARQEQAVVAAASPTTGETATQPFDPEAVYRLTDQNVPHFDPDMARGILQQAEQAQQQARRDASNLPTLNEVIVRQQQEQLPADPPIPSTATNATQANAVLEQLQSQRVDLTTQFVRPRQDGYDPSDPDRNLSSGNTKRSWLDRLLRRNAPEDQPVAKIRVTASGGPAVLNDNVEAKLSSFTTDAFSDFNTAVPQLRAMANQAAQAVGYYDAQFRFSKTADNALTVAITPNEPVIVKSQLIEITGEGASRPAFRVIPVVPDLNPGDVLHHGLYETTKNRITTAASNLGYFDSYWRMHDVRVQLPQNIADIQLKYETGPRYKLQAVEFRMSDPAKPFPLRAEVLQKLVPFKAGDDYSNWRINTLTSNLIDSRYFNASTVNVVRPTALQRPLELPDDVRQLLTAQQQKQLTQQTATAREAPVVRQQRVVNENVFAGGADPVDSAGRNANAEDDDNDTGNDTAADGLGRSAEQVENDRLRIQARRTKTIPVIVTLNADQLNNIEAGVGYGTDSGPRVRSQYRRAIVNDRGHSFDANIEVSKIRQAFDGRYMIPYKDPINDYINLVGGYERELRSTIGQNLNLTLESAVFGAERSIKRPLGEWQQTYALRYRLDRISGADGFNAGEIPEAFRVISDNPQQQSLLAGYQISKTTQDERLDPKRGLRQFYGVQVGSKQLLSETDMAILNAGWRFIYSIGEKARHQVVGRGDLGYIATSDFDHVPYNLRFFAGGDQSLRGFDYKSLSPAIDGLLLGGQMLATGSLEYNYLVRPKWRGAVFVDVGNAYSRDFSNPTAYSVGAGVRWASPIGPIRIDVAAGISADQIPVRLHFFIGPPL